MSNTMTSVPDVLTRSRDVVHPAMVAAVERLNPELRRIAAYHLGWCDEHGAPSAQQRGGKGVRPALAVLSAEASGAAAAVGVPGAVAVELAHNFSLLHDDVIDGDRERRHRPTVWALYGIGPAILVGDALMALGHQILLEAGASGAPEAEPTGEAGARAARSEAARAGSMPRRAGADRCRRLASAELTDAVAAMIGGQADDMAFEGRADVRTDECLGMVEGKTGALLSCAAAIGAVLADAPAPAIDALRSYGAHLGVAFQAVDDILGIWGDPARTGKPRGNDLATRKKSLPVVFALGAGGTAATELRALLLNGPLDDDAVARGTELVEGCGARHRTEVLARDHLDAACRALDGAGLARDACAELKELARFVVEREF